MSRTIGRLLLQLSEDLQEGLEKEAGGLQSLGKMILALRKSGLDPSRLVGLEQKLLGRVGTKGMRAFNKKGVVALKGEGYAAATGKKVKAIGTTKAVRAVSSARGRIADRASGAVTAPLTRSTSAVVRRMARGGQRHDYRFVMGMPMGSARENLARKVARHGKDPQFIQARRARGFGQSRGLPGSALPPSRRAATTQGLVHNATPNQYGQYPTGAVSHLRTPQPGNPQAGGLGAWWQRTHNRPGFWPAAAMGAGAAGGAYMLANAMGGRR